MTPAPVPADEADRLNALRDLLLLDTRPKSAMTASPDLWPSSSTCRLPC